MQGFFEGLRCAPQNWNLSWLWQFFCKSLLESNWWHMPGIRSQKCLMTVLFIWVLQTFKASTRSPQVPFWLQHSKPKYLYGQSPLWPMTGIFKFYHINKQKSSIFKNSHLILYSTNYCPVTLPTPLQSMDSFQTLACVSSWQHLTLLTFPFLKSLYSLDSSTVLLLVIFCPISPQFQIHLLNH